MAAPPRLPSASAAASSRLCERIVGDSRFVITAERRLGSPSPARSRLMNVEPSGRSAPPGTAQTLSRAICKLVDVPGVIRPSLRRVDVKAACSTWDKATTAEARRSLARRREFWDRHGASAIASASRRARVYSAVGSLEYNLLMVTSGDAGRERGDG